VMPVIGALDVNTDDAGEDRLVEATIFSWPLLFATKGHRWVQPCRTAGRNIAGKNSRAHQYKRST
jgi:hypothetical protein